MAKPRSAAKFMASSTETSGAQPAGGKKHARDFWTEKDVFAFTPLSGGKAQRSLSLSLAVTQEQNSQISVFWPHPGLCRLGSNSWCFGRNLASHVFIPSSV